MDGEAKEKDGARHVGDGTRGEVSFYSGLWGLRVATFNRAGVL